MPTKKTPSKSKAVAVRNHSTLAPWQKFAQTIIAVNAPSAMSAVYSLCFIAVVVLKLIRPDAEIYSLLAVLIILALRSFAKIGSGGEQ